MLRNVLADYLDRVEEREFDLPLLSLLPAMGFYDVHFTHGQVEFGKDIVAKRDENDITIQYSFQSKAGDIDQTEWRNKVQGQMLESIITKLSHPHFDRNLPHQSILGTTGRLTGNVAIALDDLNQQIVSKFQERPITVWDKEILLQYIEQHGIGGVHYADAIEYTSLANFYLAYGKCLQGHLSDREIEALSRHWLDLPRTNHKSISISVIEAEIIAGKLLANGYYYEAIFSLMGAARVIAHSFTYTPSEKLLDLWRQSLKRIHGVCASFLDEFVKSWKKADRNILRLEYGPSSMPTYLAQCARIAELAGLRYFMEDSQAAKSKTAKFISDFIDHEPGVNHLLSDRYAVSLVLPVLALCDQKKKQDAIRLITKATIWLCDRYEQGLGIASIDADEFSEIATLLGYHYDFLPVRRPGGSIAATVLCDLAAFIGDANLYRDVVNDIKASGIATSYYQALDTEGLFTIEGEDVVMYPNTNHSDTLSDFRSLSFAEHVRHEPKTYRIVAYTGPLPLIFLMLLLRDRYFPSIWPSMAQKHMSKH
jgi:hypothetical protein